MVEAVSHSMCNYVHHKPLLERENCKLQHIKEKWVDLGAFMRENGIAGTFTLKVIVPLGIIFAEFDRTKLDHIYCLETVSAKLKLTLY